MTQEEKNFIEKNGRYKYHVIHTNNERLTSGFRTPDRPTHDGADFTDMQRLERTQDVCVTAFADGTVVDVGKNNIYGNYADIAHNTPSGKFLTIYRHMKDGNMMVRAGESIKRGQVIGAMGTTGDSTGIHLHFGLKENSTGRNNGVYADPEPYMYGVKSMGTNSQNLDSQNITSSARGDSASPNINSTNENSSQTKEIRTRPNLCVGERVRILLTAKTYAGASSDVRIPDRYKGETYTVDAVKSDQVRLKELFSWVWVADVEHV